MSSKGLGMAIPERRLGQLELHYWMPEHKPFSNPTPEPYRGTAADRARLARIASLKSGNVKRMSLDALNNGCSRTRACRRGRCPHDIRGIPAQRLEHGAGLGNTTNHKPRENASDMPRLDNNGKPVSEARLDKPKAETAYDVMMRGRKVAASDGHNKPLTNPMLKTSTKVKRVEAWRARMETQA